VWEAVTKGLENPEEFKPYQSSVGLGVSLRDCQEKLQRAISEGIENHLPGQTVSLKAVIVDYVDIMCRIGVSLGKISAFCDSFMDACFLGMPKDYLLKIAKGFHSAMSGEVQLCAEGITKLCVATAKVSQDIVQNCGSVALKAQAKQVEDDLAEYKKAVSERASAEGELKALQCKKEFFERDDLVEGIFKARIDQLAGSQRYAQSRYEALPPNTPTTGILFWKKQGRNYDSDRSLYREQIQRCTNDIKELHSFIQKESSSRKDRLAETLSAITRAEGDVDKAKVTEEKKQAAYEGSFNKLKDITSKLEVTSVEALGKAENLQKALTQSIIPFGESFGKLNQSAACVDPEYLRPFMMSVCRLAIAGAAFSDEGLLHTYFDRDCAIYQGARKLTKMLETSQLSRLSDVDDE